MKGSRFRSPIDVRAMFPSVSFLGKFRTVYNIGGNKYRLITVVDYALQSVSIECVLTHAEYDEGRWRK